MTAFVEKGLAEAEVAAPNEGLVRPETSSGESVEEVLSAAGVGFKDDDPTLPCLTLRMWTIGIAFCLVGSGVNTLYTLRFPSISLSQSAIQFLAYPVGKAWEYAIPDWGFTLFGKRHSLNPGPFNHKENMLIYILANLSFLTRLSADVLTEQRVFYGLKAGWGFEILATLTSILFGFALSGLTRSVVVEPKSLVWPGVLGNTALNAALHTPRKEVIVGKISRYHFFILAFVASFCWYWFPDFIFPALGYFTWICWIAPKNPVVNQVFGMKSGLGLLPFTFDWSQIAYIGSPLVVPVWAILNVLASLVFWIYIVSPALYYSNTWFSAHLPLQSNSIFDNTGEVFNVSKVVNKKDGFTFDHDLYAQYSDIYLPVTYALNTFGLSFATISSLFVWLFLEKRRDLVRTFRDTCKSLTSKNTSTRDRLQPQYDAVPLWWYTTAALVALGIGIFTYEYYPVQLRWYGVIFGMVVSSVFFIPLAWVYATSNIKIQIDIFCRIIAGYVWEGKVLANIWFFNVGYISGIKGLAFSQDLKLGIYCGIPPRSLFLVQVVGLIVGTLGQVSVLNWALGNIPNVCNAKLAPNGFTCPFSRTHFNTSMVWGALGPRRFFETGALYRPLLWFFLVGALLPVIVYLLRTKVFPHVNWLKKIHVPLFLGGLNYIPPASGVNYGSWALFGLLFGALIKKRKASWWHRFNFVLSSALDCSVAIAGIVIFFAIFYTGAADNFSWWGTNVYKVS
ncbi:Sexual differentiation process protein isp4 [Fusarium proliferatum]|uniref:Sexual differentiation process protein isp4 n=1 Tax=Gibberella intermedia TaxID=948311 RepID=A0A420TS11_GIBIN|nr:Sexual differentiation process protein isp4 [Fusarium proliferatum]